MYVCMHICMYVHTSRRVMSHNNPLSEAVNFVSQFPAFQFQYSDEPVTRSTLHAFLAEIGRRCLWSSLDSESSICDYVSVQIHRTRSLSLSLSLSLSVVRPGCGRQHDEVGWSAGQDTERHSRLRSSCA